MKELTASVDIHRVIEREETFESGEGVRDGGREDSDENRRSIADESGSGSLRDTDGKVSSDCPRAVTESTYDGDETANRSGAVSDSTPLSLQTPIEQHPRQSSESGGQVRVDDRDRGLDVCGKGRTSVETDPADPKEDGTLDDERDVVGLERQDVGAEPASLAEEDRVDESRHSGANLDRSSSGVVEDSVLERPSFRRPNPSHDDIVNESLWSVDNNEDRTSLFRRDSESLTHTPTEEKNACGQDPSSFGGSSDEDCRDEGSKHVLIAAR